MAGGIRKILKQSKKDAKIFGALFTGQTKRKPKRPIPRISKASAKRAIKTGTAKRRKRR